MRPFTARECSAREVLCALALEMAASPRADFIVINCAGFDAERHRHRHRSGTGTGPAPGRLRYASSVDEITGIASRIGQRPPRSQRPNDEPLHDGLNRLAVRYV